MSYLSELAPGETALVQSIEKSDIGRRLSELGLVADTRIYCIARASFSGPSAYLVRGCALALRREAACAVKVQKVSSGGEIWD